MAIEQQSILLENRLWALPLVGPTVPLFYMTTKFFQDVASYITE